MASNQVQCWRRILCEYIIRVLYRMHILSLIGTLNVKSYKLYVPQYKRATFHLLYTVQYSTITLIG